MSDNDQMAADALEAQKFTRKHFVVGLDFSLQSLAELDPLCDDAEYMLAGGKNDENLELLTQIWGAYLGELLRRQTDGQWHQLDGGFRLEIGGDQLTPHEQVRQRLTEGAQFNLAEYAQAYVK